MLHRPSYHAAMAWPLHSAAATRTLEQQAQQGLPKYALMQRAGAGIAQLARAIAPHAERAWVAVGPGNNGGDGLEAAVHLHESGLSVSVSLAGVPATFPPDAAAAWARACRAGITILSPADAPSLASHDVAIDALLGLGGTRPPAGVLATLIGALNRQPCAVLAVDLPSGLHADTGQPTGECVVDASHTLALLTLKPGLFTASGRDASGEVWFDDLAVDGASAVPRAVLAPSPQGGPGRSHAHHKGSFGDVAVVGGGPGMTGAALLAARAAHAAGAGRVFVDLLDIEALALDPTRPELMFRRHWWRDSGTALKHSTVVAGCGGGEAVREALPRLLSAAPRLVLDADALNALGSDTSLQALLIARRGRGLETVLTPHPLEAARLLKLSTHDVQADRLTAAQWLADRFGAVVVLKGSGSVIARPDGLPFVNPTGNAALATAGTGDVLAGWIGGTWSSSSSAQGTRTAARAVALGFDAACTSTWWHGRAADLTASSPLRANDLIEQMHALQRKLQ